MRAIYVLEVFDKVDETLSSSHLIHGLSLADLQRMFGIDESNPMFDCYPVAEAQKAALESAAGVRIDLDRFDYFVTAESE